MDTLLLGLDIGTTACKALALEASGQVVAVAERPTPWVDVAMGAEIRAQSLEEVVRAVISDSLSRAPEATVAGVGVTGMGETGFLVDSDDRALTPGIAWHDRRGIDEAAALAHLLGRANFQARTGLPLGPDWTIAKIRPLLEGRPPPGVVWLSVAEWAVRRLGGTPVAERSLASRTGFFDVITGTWWREAAQAAGLAPHHLPPITSAGTPTGTVSRLPELAEAVLTVAGHDQPVGAVGAGAFSPADVHISCGTAEAALLSIPGPLEPATTSRATALGLTAGCHALADHSAVMGFFTGGLSLRSVLRVLGVAETGADRDRLDRAALNALTRPTGLSLDGLSEAEHRLSGLNNADPGAAWAAALEACARKGAQLLRNLELVGSPAKRVVLSGGWTKSAAFLAARRKYVPSFNRVPIGEAAARGAAMFAGLAAGVYENPQDFPAPITSEAEAHR